MIKKCPGGMAHVATRDGFGGIQREKGRAVAAGKGRTCSQLKGFKIERLFKKRVGVQIREGAQQRRRRGLRRAERRSVSGAVLKKRKASANDVLGYGPFCSS